MANPNRNTSGTFMHSPAEGLSDLPSPGAFSNPAQPSIHPDVSMTDKGGDSPANTKPSETFAGMNADTSPGNSQGVTMYEGPETPSADLGNQLAGGLGDVPRPSGSY